MHSSAARQEERIVCCQFLLYLRISKNILELTYPDHFIKKFKFNPTESIRVNKHLPFHQFSIVLSLRMNLRNELSLSILSPNIHRWIRSRSRLKRLVLWHICCWTVNNVSFTIRVEKPIGRLHPCSVRSLWPVSRGHLRDIP